MREALNRTREHLLEALGFSVRLRGLRHGGISDGRRQGACFLSIDSPGLVRCMPTSAFFALRGSRKRELNSVDLVHPRSMAIVVQLAPMNCHSITTTHITNQRTDSVAVHLAASPHYPPFLIEHYDDSLSEPAHASPVAFPSCPGPPPGALAGAFRDCPAVAPFAGAPPVPPTVAPFAGAPLVPPVVAAGAPISPLAVMLAAPRPAPAGAPPCVAGRLRLLPCAPPSIAGLPLAPPCAPPCTAGSLRAPACTPPCLAGPPLLPPAVVSVAVPLGRLPLPETPGTEPGELVEDCGLGSGRARARLARAVRVRRRMVLLIKRKVMNYVI